MFNDITLLSWLVYCSCKLQVNNLHNFASAWASDPRAENHVTDWERVCAHVLVDLFCRGERTRPWTCASSGWQKIKQQVWATSHIFWGSVCYWVWHLVKQSFLRIRAKMWQKSWMDARCNTEDHSTVFFSFFFFLVISHFWTLLIKSVTKHVCFCTYKNIIIIAQIQSPDVSFCCRTAIILSLSPHFLLTNKPPEDSRRAVNSAES